MTAQHTLPTNLLLAGDDAPAAAARQILAGLDAFLATADEAVKGDLNPIRDNIVAALGGLEPDVKAKDGVSQALLLNVLTASQSAFAKVGEVLAVSRAETKTARDGIPAAVTAEIDRQVKAGTIFTKEAVDAAVKSGVTLAHDEWAKETKMISDRKVALSSESIPVPADATMAAKEDVFATARLTAKVRAEVLKPFNLPADKLVTLCWDADEATYNLVADAYKQAAAPVVKPPSKGTGLAGGTPLIAAQTFNPLLCAL